MSQPLFLSPELQALKEYLNGEFTNKKQALDQPAWFVHLHLWFRTLPLSINNSIFLFTEQASVINFEQPYRQRLLSLSQDDHCQQIKVQYFKFKEMGQFQGGGRNPEILKVISEKDFDLLTHIGCSLNVEVTRLNLQSYHFKALPSTDEPCCFTHQNQTYKIVLGFEVNAQEYKSYEKGIDTQTGKPTWGLMGAYCFDKINS